MNANNVQPRQYDRFKSARATSHSIGFFHGAARLFAAALLITFACAALAKIDAPDHIIYGNASLFGQPSPTGAVIEARHSTSGAVLARYAIGSNPRYGQQFALRFNMDQLEPRLPGYARPGDPVKIYLNGQQAGHSAVGAIGVAVRLDIDPQYEGTGPAIWIDDPATPSYEGDTGQATVPLAVRINTTADRPVVIHWQTRDGDGTGIAAAIGGATCNNGVDYLAAEGVLTIPAGALDGSVSVRLCGDALIEPNEGFTVELTSVDDGFGVFADPTANVTIFDDDDVPELRLASIRVGEPVIGTRAAVFQAFLSRSHENPTAFSWATQSTGSATPGADYVEGNGTVTFAPGEITKTIEVMVRADTQTEADETFRLRLTNPQSLRLMQDYAYATIVDPAHDPVLTPQSPAQGGPGGVSDLARPAALAITTDGLHVYATSESKDAVLHFTRNASNGVLAFIAAYKTTTPGFSTAKLDAPYDIALSPDNTFLYVTAWRDDAITVLQRDPATGALSFVQSRVNNQPYGGITVQGIDEPMKLALSPDGAHVYALGRASNAVAVFNRDAAGGGLTFQHALTSATPGMAVLSRPQGMVVSGDGAQVYVTSRFGNALFVLNRNTDSASAQFGKLTFAAAHINGLLGITGLSGAFGVDISPDGKQLYVASENDNAVVQFNRNPATGGLVLHRKWAHDTTTHWGLTGAQGIDVAPDGIHVFVTGATDDSLSIFDRNETTGELVIRRTIFNNDGNLTLMDEPGALATTLDNQFVYVIASGGQGAILPFQRSLETPTEPGEPDEADRIFKNSFETPTP